MFHIPWLNECQRRILIIKFNVFRDEACTLFASLSCMNIFEKKQTFDILFHTKEKNETETPKRLQRAVPDPSVLTTSDLSDVRCMSEGPRKYTNTIRLQGKYLPKNGTHYMHMCCLKAQSIFLKENI